MKTLSSPTIIRDRKNGGFKIRYPDGTKSVENWAYRVGAVEAAKPYCQQEKSQWESP